MSGTPPRNDHLRFEQLVAPIRFDLATLPGSHPAAVAPKASPAIYGPVLPVEPIVDREESPYRLPRLQAISTNDVSPVDRFTRRTFDLGFGQGDVRFTGKRARFDVTF